METSVFGGFTEILISDTWDAKQVSTWLKEYWVPTSYKVVAAYLLLLYVGEKMMQKREPFKLNKPLAIWNLALSIFSLCGTIKMLPELIWAVSNLGIVGSYCNAAELYTNQYTGYWSWLFLMSKVLEFGDSMFLVLRKRPVIFMHWYHHAVTFLVGNYLSTRDQAFNRWIFSTNYTVHTIMYFYFFLRAAKVRTSTLVAKFVTTIQIVQFVIDCFVFCHMLYIKATGSVPDCASTWIDVLIPCIVSLSFFYLFTLFFFRAYIDVKPSMVVAKKIDKQA